MKSDDAPLFNLEYRKKRETRIRISLFYKNEDNISCMVYRITAHLLKLDVFRYYDVLQVLSFE